MDTPQQAAILRRSPTARRVRAKFAAGTRVVATDGANIQTEAVRHGTVEGTVRRHVPNGNAQGGTIVVDWDTGTQGRHSAGSLAVVPKRDPNSRWIVTTDRTGRRAYASPGGSVVCKDGVGTTPVTVYYPGFVDWRGNGTADYGMADTVREGKAWADAAERVTA